MSARETKKQHTEEKAVHKMTAAERAAIARHFARCESTLSIRCKVSRNGSYLQIGFDHPDRLVDRALVMDALASADEDFLNGCRDQHEVVVAGKIQKQPERLNGSAAQRSGSWLHAGTAAEPDRGVLGDPPSIGADFDATPGLIGIEKWLAGPHG